MLIDALISVLLRLGRVPSTLCRSARSRSLAGLACIGLSLLAANTLAAGGLPQHFDVTQDRLYTLSATTIETLARIDEPITLRFYYSPRLGAANWIYGLYAERVHALLEQYAAAARGKLLLRTLDPEPFSAAEKNAVAAGLPAVPISAQGEPGFFGLVGTNSTDDRAVLALFDPARRHRLEYDLTRLVYVLALPNAAAAADADLAALRRQSGAARPLALIDRLRRQRDAQYATRLEAVVEFADIAAIPSLVAAAALAIWRRRRHSAVAG